MARTTLFNPAARMRENYIGIERLNNLLEQMASMPNDGYPPYNVSTNGEDDFLIEIAVAGFKEENLEIVVEDRKLKISGSHPKEEEDSGRFLHRGIARRNFLRVFALDENVKVSQARIEDGMLKVSLKREVPEEKRPLKIEISKT